MPLFSHRESPSFLLTSYKVMYSLVSNSPEWRFLGSSLTPRLAAHITRKRQLFNVKQLVRNPYDRVVSCFMDKCRANPMWFDKDGFEWQHCQKVMFPHLGVCEQDDSSVIAARLLEVSFEEFLGILPHVIWMDPHFQPQHLARTFSLTRAVRAALPGVQRIRVEDKEALTSVPGLDLTRRIHATGHITKDFVLDDHGKRIIQVLYKHDFQFCRYSY